MLVITNGPVQHSIEANDAVSPPKPERKILPSVMVMVRCELCLVRGENVVVNTGPIVRLTA